MNNPSNIDLSKLKYNLKIKLKSPKILNLGKINESKLFSINKNPSLQDKCDKNYLKEQEKYFNNGILNSNIILMLNNYINTSETIPNNLKYKREFKEKFLNIIKTLLMNEIELASMTIVIDKIGWGNINQEIWMNLYYIGLQIKELISSDNSAKIIKDKCERNFITNYNKWRNSPNIKKIFEDKEVYSLINVNERMKKLNIKHINIKREIINYNKIVNEIDSNIIKKDKIINENNENNINDNNNENNINSNNNEVIVNDNNNENNINYNNNEYNINNNNNNENNINDNNDIIENAIFNLEDRNSNSYHNSILKQNLLKKNNIIQSTSNQPNQQRMEFFNSFIRRQDLDNNSNEEENSDNDYIESYYKIQKSPFNDY